jgi:aminoglycoside phosphotransferase (APT) family kinase protein
VPEEIPPEVAAAIAAGLGLPQIDLSPLAGGTNRRTYRARYGRRRWVARVERAPALSLARAAEAQACARAAGVRTPVTVAQALTPTASGSYRWSVETFARGRPWPGDSAAISHTLAAAADLGRQLRRLHAVAVDAFGDLPPRPYPVYATFALWAANKARRIAGAIQIAGGPPDAAAPIAQVYATLAGWYDGPPRLCKGDCAGDNILVDSAGRTTIIDWEWAQGLDPAADVAYWHGFTPGGAAYEALLAAYEPDEPSAFRRRVWAHQIVQCVETIHVYDEHSHAFDAQARAAGIGASWGALGLLLRRTPGA